MLFSRCRFIGEHGSMGYETGKVYWLNIEKYFDGYVQIFPLNPFRKACPYSNINTFHANWEEL